MKAAKKKGSDGKTTVLDVVVMHDKSDVEFSSDLPTIGEGGAMRLDLDDLRGLLREIQTGAKSIDRSIQDERSNAEVDSSFDASSKLVPFLNRATGEIENIETLFGSVEGKVQSLCSFFAEDVKTCKVSCIINRVIV